MTYNSVQQQLDNIISDIDGSIDTLVGDADFTDAQVREALVGIAKRIHLCLRNVEWSR